MQKEPIDIDIQPHVNEETGRPYVQLDVSQPSLKVTPNMARALARILIETAQRSEELAKAHRKEMPPL